MLDEHFSVMEIWANGRFKRTNKKRQQFENKKQEELVSDFGYSDAGNSLLTLPFKGHKIID